jgi:hypothetical protein
LMTGTTTWILEGILLLGVVLMFVLDNKGLWVRPKSEGPNDDAHREIRTGQ